MDVCNFRKSFCACEVFSSFQARENNNGAPTTEELAEWRRLVSTFLTTDDRQEWQDKTPGKRARTTTRRYMCALDNSIQKAPQRAFPMRWRLLEV